MTSWLDNSVEDLELQQSIKDLIKLYPDSANVIERLVNYYETKDTQQVKRRKVDQDTLTDPVLRLSDISFQSPSRKKYDLIITTTQFILYNPKLEAIESQYILKNLARSVCVPTPERPKSFTFALFFDNEESVVFNIQDKLDIKMNQKGKIETLTTDKHRTISQLLTAHTKVPIIQPSKQAFQCKSEDRAYVVAYLKAKDGFLFFLPTGILYGFKKPTLFIPIASVSDHAVTRITQRTFDLILTLKKDSSVYGRLTKEEDVLEFSMISQEEYAAIDRYIKKAGVIDQSMSEERKAVTTKKENSEESTKDESVIKEEDEDSENDENFEPSDDDDSDPLEYNTDAEEEEEKKGEDEDMLDESD